MTHEDAREKLLDLAYGELEPSERVQVELHVSVCAGCAAELADLARTRAAASLLPDPDLPGGRAELLEAARRAVAGEVRPRRTRWSRPVGWMAVAATVLAVGGLTMRWMDESPRREVSQELAFDRAAEAAKPAKAATAATAATAAKSAPRAGAALPSAAKAEEEAAPAGFPPGTSGAFVSLDLRNGKRFRVNPEGCTTRFPPFSTFKIPSSLIGLETGVVKDPDERWHWDAAKYPPPSPSPGGDYLLAWQQDQSLRTALARSIVWYFREVATRVGEPRMKLWLATFDYGNQDVSGGLDRFWLGRSLRISPDEQVEFLARLERGQFPVARRNLDLVKEVLTQGSGAGYRLIAKTGSSPDGEGWLVGWVEATGGVCAFALHLNAPSFEDMARVRAGLARDFLRQAGCIPR